MKKIITILSLISLVLSLISCNVKEGVDSDANLLEPLDKFDIAETKEIVLGNVVDSVVFTTRTGEKVTFDNTADFYEMLDKVGSLVGFENGKKYSYIAETKFENQVRFYIRANIYYIDGGRFDEFRTKKDGKDTVAIVERYSGSKQSGNQFITRLFEKTIYEDDKAFGGSEKSENRYEVYKSDSYPMHPQSGSELDEMYSSSIYPLNLVSLTGLFNNYELYETFVTREYELYENYIVFKQTAPFLMVNIGPGQDPDLLYELFSNANCSITQEVYYNVKTGEMELIKVYGNTLWHLPEYFGKNIEINMQIYIHDINKSECEQKIDNLIDYVKSNSN